MTVPGVQERPNWMADEKRVRDAMASIRLRWMPQVDRRRVIVC